MLECFVILRVSMYALIYEYILIMLFFPWCTNRFLLGDQISDPCNWDKGANKWISSAYLEF